MVLDTSAIVAILFAEPEAERFSAAIEAAEVRLVSTANLVEVGLVLLSRKGEAGLIDLQRFLADADVDRIPVDEQQAQLAVAAFRDFGRGPASGRSQFR